MNFEIVNKIINYIEDNYHEALTVDIIKNLTGASEGYVRDEFKKIVGISLDKYRIRRELSIIIKEILINKCNIKDADLTPWNERSFSTAFKKEFGCTPKQALSNMKCIRFQEKFDVDQYKKTWDENSKTIEKLIRKYGNAAEALKFLLSLRAYELEPLDLLFCHSEDDLKNILIKRKYSNEIYQKFYAASVPEKFIKQHKRLLNEFYNLKNAIIVKQCIDEVSIDEIRLDMLPPTHYYIVKRGLIKDLINKIKDKDLANIGIAPTELVTIWSERLNVERLYDNQTSIMKEGEIAIPNELYNADISILRRKILEYLLIQEQNFMKFNTYEKLCKEIKFDYNMPIDIFAEYCKKCEYKKNCDNNDCKYIDELDDKDKQEFYDKPDYEELTIERLNEEIMQMLIDGLIYVKNFDN